MTEKTEEMNSDEIVRVAKAQFQELLQIKGRVRRCDDLKEKLPDPGVAQDFWDDLQDVISDFESGVDQR